MKFRDKWSTFAVLAVCGAAGAGVTAEAGRSATDWAFPTPAKTDAAAERPAPEGGFSVPGSNRRYSAAEVGDLFHAVDWFPERRVGAPRAVLEGRRPGPMACGSCHLTDGQGRPENAALAGLPAAYMIGQVKAFHDGARVGADPAWRPTALMRQTAQAASAEEVEAAARWFAAQRYVPAFRLVEAREIMAVKPAGSVYAPRSGGGRELLGERIVEVPNDLDRFALHDNRPGYTVYIPLGSIARGRTLAETGGSGRFAPCASCHGAGLKGGVGPPLAGRYPAYLFRQFLAFSEGGRQGAGAAPMIEIASKLKPDEMIALSAYAASLAP